MRTGSATLLDAVVASSNQTSGAFSLAHLEGCAVQAVFSGGTPSGTAKLQGSTDAGRGDLGKDAAPANWTDIAGSGQAVTAAGDVLWNLAGAYFRHARVVWTALTGSTGNVTVTAYGKGAN